MKCKYVLIAATYLFTMGAFAQKDELKAAEKAFKAQNSAEAKNILIQSESLFENLPNAEKAKFYSLKGNVLLDLAKKNTEVSKNLEMAAKTFQTLLAVEANEKKQKYSEAAKASIDEIVGLLVNEAIKLGQEKDYKTAAERLYLSYQLDKTRQDNLYYAASYAVNGQDFDKALEYYEMLKELNYSGEKTIYAATNVISGEVENFASKDERDRSVKMTLHKDPVDEKEPSKKGEIYSNYALILIQKGEIEKAKSAVQEARKLNPDDVTLIVTEANMYFNLEDFDSYQKLIQEAIAKDPKNPELFYNLGVVSTKSKDTEKAKEYFRKAIELDPKYSDAYLNLAAAILEKDQAIIEKMNSLGNSAADNKKYDQYKLEREEVMKEAYPFLEKTLETGNNEIEVKRTLMNIYYTLDMTDKYKKLKEEVDNM